MWWSYDTYWCLLQDEQSEGNGSKWKNFLICSLPREPETSFWHEWTKIHSLYCYLPQTKLREGTVFTHVCLFTGGLCPGRGGGSLSGKEGGVSVIKTFALVHLVAATAADGMHPTGIHSWLSCCLLVFTARVAKWAKVMFLQACVTHSVQWGAQVTTPPSPGTIRKRAVRILLECILVWYNHFSCRSHAVYRLLCTDLMILNFFKRKLSLQTGILHTVHLL